MSFDPDSPEDVAAALGRYAEIDWDTGDLVYRYVDHHFAGVDIFGAEARDMWNLMFQDEVEEDSPVDAALHGVICMGWDAAINSLVFTLNADDDGRESIAGVLDAPLWEDPDGNMRVPDKNELIRCLQSIQRMVSNRLFSEMHGSQ